MSKIRRSAKDIDEMSALGMIDAYSTAVHAGEEPPFDVPWLVWVARGFHENVVSAKYDKFDRKGYMDYGVSLRTGWLTEKGKARLEELRQSCMPDAGTPPHTVE